MDVNKRAVRKEQKVPRRSHHSLARVAGVFGEARKMKDLEKRAQIRTARMTSLKNKLAGSCWT